MSRGRWDCADGHLHGRLGRLLPPTEKRSSVDRLDAIAGRAYTDGSRTVKPRLRKHEAEDCRAHLIETGLRAVLVYDEELDRSDTVPLEVRFGRFAYLRMRRALVDWVRKNRTDLRVANPVVEFQTDPDDLDEVVGEFDFVERLVAARRVERWVEAATRGGLSTTEWLVGLADAAADLELMEEAL